MTGSWDEMNRGEESETKWAALSEVRGRDLGPYLGLTKYGIWPELHQIFKKPQRFFNLMRFFETASVFLPNFPPIIWLFFGCGFCKIAYVTK